MLVHLGSLGHVAENLALLRMLLERYLLMKMSVSKPVRCQKCEKPVGYITVLAKGLLLPRQPLENIKIVAICMECFGKSK